MSKMSFTRTKMDPSGLGRRGNLQLLDCSYSFTLRGKEKFGTRCRCSATKLSEGYPEEIDCGQRLAEIRTRWCKEHKDIDRFGPPERNTLRPVWWFVSPLILFDVSPLEGSLLALI